MKTITATAIFSDDQSTAFEYYKDELKEAFDEVRDIIYKVSQKNDRKREFKALKDARLAVDEVTIDDCEYLPEEIQDEYFEKHFPDLEKTTVSAKGCCQGDWQEFEIIHKKGADIKKLCRLLRKAMAGEEYAITIKETLESGHYKEIDYFDIFVPLGASDNKKKMITEDIQARFPDENILIDLKNVY